MDISSTEAKDIYKKLESSNIKYVVWDPYSMDLFEFTTHFLNANKVITSRMHTVFISNLLNTYTIAIDVHPKLKIASELFYDNPIVVSPLANKNDYYKVLTNNPVRSHRLKIEISKVEKLNDDLIEVLNNFKK